MSSFSETTAIDHEKWIEKFGEISGQFSSFLNEELLADVVFVVGSDQTRVLGHKFVLSACSWEFYVVFCLLKLDSKELPIEDVNTETFLSFLEFCYKGKLHLDGRDAWGILKLAKRFNVQQLIKKCEEYLNENLNSETCLDFYAKATFLQEDSMLMKKIYNRIAIEFIYLTNNPSFSDIFCNLTLGQLKKIADMENLCCDEMLLFDALMKWAKFNCEKVEIPCEPRNLRKILGDTFYSIRFPVMKAKWIIEILSNYPGMLTHEEVANISKVIIREELLCPKFSWKFRTYGYAYMRNPANFSEYDCKRISCFENAPGKTKLFKTGMSIAFKCKEPKVLMGFGLFVLSKRKKVELSCILEKEDKSLQTIKDDDMYSFKYYWPLCWDYTYKQVHFKNRLSIASEEWHTVHVMANYELPILLTSSQSSLKDFDEENEIYFKGNEGQIIPYLIFE